MRGKWRKCLRFNASAPGTELGFHRGMKRMHLTPDRRRGFTLAELMVVIVIITLMAAMAGPRMVRFIQTVSQRGAFNQLVADLSLARMQAVRQGTTVSLRIDDATTYRITVDDAVGNPVRTLKQVNVAANQRGTQLSPEGGRIAFDSRGVSRPAPVSTINEVTLKRGPARKRVRVSGVGRIELVQ